MTIVTATPPAGIANAGRPDSRNVLLSVRDVRKVYGSREAVTRALDDVFVRLTLSHLLQPRGEQSTAVDRIRRTVAALIGPSAG